MTIKQYVRKKRKGRKWEHIPIEQAIAEYEKYIRANYFMHGHYAFLQFKEWLKMEDL